MPAYHPRRSKTAYVVAGFSAHFLAFTVSFSVHLASEPELALHRDRGLCHNSNTHEL